MRLRNVASLQTLALLCGVPPQKEESPVKPGSDGAAYWEPAIDTEVDRMRREGLCLLSPKSPERIVTELQEVTRGPMMYPSSVCESVPFQIAAGLDAVPEITEAQVAEEIERVIAERETEANRLSVGRRDNVLMLKAIDRAPEFAMPSEPPTKPRSKRGQRQRRWR